MMKRLLTLSAFAAMVVFSGCGNEDTTCRIDVQKDIDQGSFDSAISKLNGSCKSAFSEVIKVMVESNDDSNSDGFSTFTKSINKNKKSNSLELLGKAKSYFLRSLDPSIPDVQTLFNTYCASTNSNSTSNSRVSNACFYVGFNDVIRTSVTVGELTKNLDQAVQAIDANDASSVPLDMKASLDALAWATGQNAPYPNGSNITSLGVTTIKGTNYNPLIVTNSSKTFYRLADENAPSTNSSTVLTSGYCTADGNTTVCDGIENPDGSIDLTKIPTGTTCYACPISVEDNSTTTKIADLLVETLNNGADSILSISDDPDIAQSVKDFKKEITGSEDGNVTIEYIMKYLNAQQ